MDMPRLGTAIVFAMVLGARSASADSPPPPPPPPITAGASVAVGDVASGDDSGAAAGGAYADFQHQQVALFDALRADPSPRQQVLAGRIYIDEDDATPSALRSKREDVVARAVHLAPDDAFVQYMAAAQGNYTSSACGPTHLPATEVANLLRLEPDNAAALQFAVALAVAKHDEPGVDDALSRMAATSRADDHLTDEIVAWKTLYAAHPDQSAMASAMSGDAKSNPQSRALISALMKTNFRSAPVGSEVESACKPDGSSDITWQRLGWCADAGRLLASKGSSLALREQGLKMLAAIGNHDEATADLQRDYDWLEQHAANPLSNPAAADDAGANLLADWQGATSEIAAIEHRLAREGQPKTPPPGWLKQDEAQSESADATQKPYMDYMRALLDDMRAGSDPRQRALALGAMAITAVLEASDDAGDAKPTPASTETLASLAAAHPDDVLVQWIAAGDSDSAANAAAIANLQRLDKDNGAVWALSLDHRASAQDTAQVLQHIAASPRFEEHDAEMLGVWLDAIDRHPFSTEFADALRATAPMKGFSAETAAKAMAMAMSLSSQVSFAAPVKITTACQPGKRSPESAATKDSCIAVGRLLSRRGGSLATAMMGDSILRRSGAPDGEDAKRALQLAWWRETVMPTLATDAASIDTFVTNILITGSEVEALRFAAGRLGKSDPPAGWKSPSDRVMKAVSKAE